MFDVLLFILFLILMYHLYVHYGKKGRLINLIPGPPTIPILGNSLWLNVPLDKLWQVICKLQDQYYPIIRIWICHVPYIAIRHPDDMKIILSSKKHIEKGVIYTLSHSWLQTGLLTSEVDKWQTRRKLLTPTFHYTILEHFVDIFDRETNQMISVLKNSRGPIVKELWPLISEFTLNAICETAMGISLRDFTENESESYRDAFHQMTDILMYRVTRPWLYNNWLTSLLPIGRKQRKILSTLHGFTEKIIAERKRYHNLTGGQYLNTSDNDIEINGIRKRRIAFLDFLIANQVNAANSKKRLTDLDIREEVDTFTAAGHDTIAHAICFALMLLAKHNDIQIFEAPTRIVPIQEKPIRIKLQLDRKRGKRVLSKLYGRS